MASAGTAYVDVEARVDELASSISDAITSIDTQTIDVQAEVTANTDEVQAEIDALDGGTIDVTAVAETDTAQDEIDAIEGGTTEKTVTADTEQAQASIDELTGTISSAADAAGLGGGAVGGFGAELAGLAGASSGATAGLTALVGGFVLAGNAAMEAEVVSSETDSMLSSLGSSAVVSADQISDLSQRIMEYSGFSDEAVQAGANTLLMFDNINTSATFDRALEGAADLARRMGTEVPQAARMLGLALQDPEAGMNRLRRAGIVLTDAQKEQVSAFMEVGDVASAQDVILSSLEGRIGNLAEDYGGTAAGAMDKLKQSMDEVAEAAGTSLLPAITLEAEGFAALARQTQALDSALNGALLSGPLQAILGIGDGMRANGRLVGEWGTGMDAAASSTSGFAAAADDARNAVGMLDERVQGYLDGVFRVPEAERALRDSFQTLQDTLNSPDASFDDVAVDLQGIVEAAAELGVATGDMPGAVDAAVFSLSVLASQGKLSADQVADVKGQLDTLATLGPTEATVTAPGAVESRSQIDQVTGALMGVPPGAAPPITAPGAVRSAGEIKAVDDAVRKVPPSWMTTISVPGATNATGVVRTHDGAVRSVPQSWTSTFVANTGTARGNIDALISRIQALNSAVASMPSTNSIAAQVGAMNAALAGSRARGGPMDPDKVYLVGEQGPELVVPKSAGTVVPAPQTAALLGADRSAATYNVTVYAPTGDGDSIARAIREELIKLERSDR